MRRGCGARIRWRRSCSVGPSAHCRSSNTSSSGAPARDLGQQRGERVEQALALDARVAADRRRAGGAPSSGSSAARSAARGPSRWAGHGERGAAGPAAQHLEDRPVGAGAGLVEAAVEDDRAVAVDGARELRREPRLADPRLAGEQDEPPLVADRRVPRAAQRGQRLAPPDERVLRGGRGERGGQRAGRGGRGGGASGGGPSPRSSRSWTAITAGPGAVPSSSRSRWRSSSNARSASAGLPDASWTSISSRCEDSRNGASPIAVRAACSAASSSRPPSRSPASPSASSARSRRPSTSRRRSRTHGPSHSARNGSAPKRERGAGLRGGVLVARGRRAPGRRARLRRRAASVSTTAARAARAAPRRGRSARRGRARAAASRAARRARSPTRRARPSATARPRARSAGRRGCGGRRGRRAAADPGAPAAPGGPGHRCWLAATRPQRRISQRTSRATPAASYSFRQPFSKVGPSAGAAVPSAP